MRFSFAPGWRIIDRRELDGKGKMVAEIGVAEMLRWRMRMA